MSPFLCLLFVRNVVIELEIGNCSFSIPFLTALEVFLFLFFSVLWRSLFKISLIQCISSSFGMFVYSDVASSVPMMYFSLSGTQLSI